ncbi:unnamed protein product [Phaedon cochleariae]|uniref:UDP-glucuronosyltransferase n=1 Tax=Phaedon cochleariae TaxID=80249 RepID=A0A9P0DHD5_PHACE|nr:unnamed protein product [Phaedon cochleariae]
MKIEVCQLVSDKTTTVKMMLLLIFLAAINLTQSAKILGIFPIPSRNHFVTGSRLMRELANRGHQVTVVSPFEETGTQGNYTGIHIGNTIPVLKRFQKSFYERESMNFISSTNYLHNMAYELTEALLTDSTIQHLLKSNKNFDLVVIEYFMNEAALGIANILKTPIVLVSSLPPSTLNNHLFANPLPTSYVPNILTSYSGDMSYWQRFNNLLYNAYNNYYRTLRMLPKHNQLMEECLGKNLDFYEVITSVNLILLNSHPSVTEPVPLMPNMIEIGGAHLGPLCKLPDDLEDFMDSAKDGVILFSMGSNLKSADLGSEKIESLISAFRQIRQRVLWKLEEELPDLPGNVKVVNWIPQAEVLAHPNTKAFITHGGLFSTIEAVHFGVPIVGIPVYGDQKSNIARAVRDEYAVSVPFTDISSENVAAAIHEILKPKYSLNIQQRSRDLRDRPVEPLANAIYWIEFILNHDGAKYLQSPGVKLPSYKRHLIDVIIVLVIIDIVLFLIFYYIFKHIIHLLREKVRERRSQKYSKLEK